MGVIEEFLILSLRSREFGGYHSTGREREYNSHELGNWNRLPRGSYGFWTYYAYVSVYRRGVDVPRLTIRRTYYKSVHLEPDKAANDKARHQKLQEEARRVIVDDPVFKVGGFLPRPARRVRPDV